jgi:flagellar motor protein MotB
MKKFFVVLVMMSFVLSVTGLLFAQTPSSTALEKASDSATFKRDDSKPASKPDAEKMKSEKEKASKEKAEKEKTGKGKVAEEKATQEKALKEKGKTKQENIKLNPEDVKKP